ncbi:MAG: YhfC family glutamic-type intramembrane protease, partial [Neglectibacter sp.]
MISVPVILTFALALFLTLLFPIMLILILAWKKKISLLPLGFGFLSFLLSQVLTRIPLLQAFSTQEWYQNFAVLHPVVLGLLLAFTAGLFEETARLGGSALLGPRKPAFPGGPARPGYRTFEGALSFGLGHAFCEVILLAGLTH